MYRVYLGKLLFPVPPDKIEWSWQGRSEVVSLLDQSEAVLPRPVGLGEISFQVLLPHQVYPFGYYPDGFFQTEVYFTEQLEKMARAGKPLAFVIVRDGVRYKERMEQVVLESYTLHEDAENGFDLVADLKLRCYRRYESVRVEVQEDGAAALLAVRESDRAVPSEEAPVQYVVQPGDCLWNICRAQYGDGAKCWEVAERNGIGNPNILTVGQVITLG